MPNTRNKVLLYRTKSKGSANANIEHGEIALNYNAETPFIMLKDSDDTIQKIGVLSNSSGQSEYHTMSQKAITDAIDTLNTEISDIASSVTDSANEVLIGSNEPTGETSIELFIDESINPINVEVYSKSEIDTKVTALNSIDTSLTSSINSKVTYGDTIDASTATNLYVDTSSNDSIEVYTRAQVDAIINQLKLDNNLK